MGLVSQSLDNLLNGVSQQTPRLRQPSQGEVQDNGLSSPVFGLMKRPPTQHKAKLTATVTGFDAAQVHSINRDASERYRVVFLNGDLQVYDQNGVACTVNFPDGKSYLGTATPAKDIRACTVGDSTFIINRNVQVRKGTATAPANTSPGDSLITVRVPAYNTLYTITLFDNIIIGIGAAGTFVANYITPTADSVNAARFSSVGAIAAGLYTALHESTNESGAHLSDYAEITLDGANILIHPLNGSPWYNLTLTDGISGEAMSAIRVGSIQRFEDLPATAPVGYIAHILGAADTDVDDYYVKFDGQVWREVAAPGVLTDLDAATMPLQLVRESSDILNNTVGYVSGKLPTISDATAATPGHWLDGPGGSPVADTLSPLLLPPATPSPYENTQYGDLAGLTGPASVIVTYDIRTALLDPPTLGVTVELRLLDSSDSSDVVVDSLTYNQDNATFFNQQLEYDGTLTATQSLRVRVLVLGGDPTSPTQAYRLTLHSHDATIPGISVSLANGTRVVFPDGTYPKDATFTFSVNGTPLAFSYGGVDLSAAALVTALLALLPVGVTAVDVSALAFTLQGTPTPTVAATTAAGTVKLFVIDTLTLTPGALVGKTLINLTTGSSGVIASNTATVVEMTALTGGTRQTFLAGDVVQISGSTVTFTCKKVTWTSRAAGDDTTNPFPSFTGLALSDIFFYNGRIGLLAEDRIVLSSVSDVFNFFRKTVTDLLADDVIDVQSASQSPADFHSAVPWGGKLYAFSGHTQFLLDGEPILAPSTARLPSVTDYQSSRNLRPIAVGERIFFAQESTGSTRILDYSFNRFSNAVEGADVTAHIPTYLAGKPVQMAGDDALGFLAVLTDGGSRQYLYVYSYRIENFDRVQSSWSRWTFPGATVVGMDMIDGVLGLVLKRSDGVYLETIDLVTPPDPNADHQDRQGTTPLVPYTFTYQFTTLFYRDRNGNPKTSGRFQLRRMLLKYADTKNFTVTVTPTGRTSYTYTLALSAPDKGAQNIPVLSVNDKVTIAITDATNGGCRFSGADYEGEFSVRHALG